MAMTQTLTHYFTEIRVCGHKQKDEVVKDVCYIFACDFSEFSVWSGIREIMKNEILDSYQSLTSWFLNSMSFELHATQSRNLSLTPAFIIYSTVIKQGQGNLKVCLLFIFSHLFYIYFTPSLYDLQHAIYGQRNWILMFLKSEIK